MANNLAGKGKDPGRREAMRMALTGEWPRRLLRGELVVDDVFIRDVVGLEGEAIPWSARHAVLKRFNHDLAVVSFSGGWGAPQQPDPEEAEFLVQQWHDESDLFVLALVDGPFSAAAPQRRAVPGLYRGRQPLVHSHRRRSRRPHSALFHRHGRPDHHHRHGVGAPLSQPA